MSSLGKKTPVWCACLILAVNKFVLNFDSGWAGESYVANENFLFYGISIGYSIPTRGVYQIHEVMC